MSPGSNSAEVYRFGVFEALPRAGELQKNGVRVKLQEQPFQLLIFLLENAGEIVSRDAVRQRLWQGNTFVDFDASLSVAVGKLRDALGDSADSPRFIETVPRRGYRFIAPVKVVEKPLPLPPAAPSSAPPPDGTLESHPSAQSFPDSPAQTAPTSASAGRLMRRALVVAIVLSVVAFVAWRLFGKRRDLTAKATPAAAASPVHARRSIAVLGFRNLPGRHDDDWMSGAFTEMLGTELGAGGSLRIVSDEDVARAKRDIATGDQETLSQSTLKQLRKDPGADDVVVGSYAAISTKGEKRIRLDIRVQDTETGDTVAEDVVSGTDEELFEMVSRAGADLRTSLGVYPLQPDDANQVRASLPVNNAAVKAYSEGMTKLWAFDFVGARDDFTKSLNADPNYPLAHAALSDAFWHLGYTAKSISAAKHAVDLSKRLPQEQQLLISAQYAKATGDWPAAVNTYKSLFDLRRDRLDYGLALANAEFHANSPNVEQTLETLRHLPPPANDDARIDLLEASVEVGHDASKSQAAARRAIAKGEALGSPLLVARAYGILCQWGPATGISMDEVTADCNTAIQSYAAAGDKYNEARTLSDSAAVYYSRGDLTTAKKVWSEAAKAFSHLDERQGSAATRNNLGDVLLLEGHLAEARQTLSSAIPDYEAVEDTGGVALILNDLAELSREEGNLQAAEVDLRKAQALAAGRNDGSPLAYVYSSLGDVQMARGDLAEARNSYEKSLSLRTQIGEVQSAAQTQMSLAKLSIEEGHAADAERVAREVKRTFEQQEQADDRIRASIVLAEALLAQKKYSDAQKEIEASASLLSKNQDKLLQLQFRLTSARAQLGTSHTELAGKEIQAIRAEATAAGFVAFEFETRLALADWTEASGNPAQSKPILDGLQKAATQRGFTLVADKATAKLQTLTR
ncbi:MAG TPA: winged helix-turn-helix domain-containing protein [Candidatus Acidoferrum sp.]|jgi:DNA-binding winged helix-turn-helix (wHTH) protein/tetratricopeptide (TPR) repeat protein